MKTKTKFRAKVTMKRSCDVGCSHDEHYRIILKLLSTDAFDRGKIITN